MKPKPMPKLTEAQKRRWLRRALAAYYADETAHGWPNTDRDAACSGVIRRRGLYEVVLGDERKELARYRIRHPDRQNPYGRLMWVA